MEPLGLTAVFTVFAFVTATVFAAEGVTWYLVHSSSVFQSLKRSVDRRQAKIAKLKSKAVPDHKALEREGAELETEQKQLISYNFRSMLATSGSMILAYNILSGWYGGLVVAKLPFEPVYFFKSIAQRGLDAEHIAPNDCSYVFILALTAMMMRPIAEQVLGTQKPKGLSFSEQMAAAQKSV